MKDYHFRVTETREVEMLYRVEAESEAEAREKAEAGDTAYEQRCRSSVVNRQIEECISRSDAL